MHQSLNTIRLNSNRKILGNSISFLAINGEKQRSFANYFNLHLNENLF